MIKHADENPATYLNKGYTYYLSVADTSAMELLVQETINQAFVRISFEDNQQQQQRPGIPWDIWQKGRGNSEAQQNIKKL